MIAEEEVFYQPLGRDNEAWQEAYTGTEQHHRIRMILDELLETPATTVRFMGKVSCVG